MVNLLKTSVMTNTFSRPSEDGSNTVKSIATTSNGCVAMRRPRGVRNLCGCIFASAQRSHFCVQVRTSLCIVAQNTGFESDVPSVLFLDGQHNHAFPSILGRGDKWAEVTIAILRALYQQCADTKRHSSRQCVPIAVSTEWHSSIQSLSLVSWVFFPIGGNTSTAR